VSTPILQKHGKSMATLRKKATAEEAAAE
jgi:hypothetical protein